MPHGTARAPHVRLCGQFTALSHVGWKKIEIFFLSIFVPLWPLSSGLLTPTKIIFFFAFFLQLKIQKIEWLTRNVYTRYIEDQQTYDSLAKGLPYSSIRNGDQQSLEKYVHGRLSHAEGWPKNLPALRIELLLETHFITALIVQHIKEIGEGRVFVVCVCLLANLLFSYIV